MEYQYIDMYQEYLYLRWKKYIKSYKNIKSFIIYLALA